MFDIILNWLLGYGSCTSLGIVGRLLFVIRSSWNGLGWDWESGDL